MGWYLVLVLYSTSDVLIKKFDDKNACEKYRVAHVKEFKKLDIFGNSSLSVFIFLVLFKTMPKIPHIYKYLILYIQPYL